MKSTLITFFFQSGDAQLWIQVPNAASLSATELVSVVELLDAFIAEEEVSQGDAAGE